jgi:hypothetical protein
VSRARDESYFTGGSILTSSAVDPFSCKLRVRNWTDGVSSIINHTSELPIGGNRQTRFMGPTGVYNSFYVGGNSSLTFTCDLPHDASVLTYTFDGQG